MTLQLALLIVAFLCFVFGAIGWPVLSKVDWVAAGLAVLTFALYLLPHIG
jgi:hypothetical protein